MLFDACDLLRSLQRLFEGLGNRVFRFMVRAGICHDVVKLICAKEINLFQESVYAYEIRFLQVAKVS